jgi:hypothetical protein
MEKKKAPVIPVRVLKYHADDTRIDDGHGACQTWLVGGVKLCTFSA